MLDELMKAGTQPAVDIGGNPVDRNGQPTQPNGQQIQAGPNLYIDVMMPGPNGPVKTVYDLATAYALRDALNGALQAFDKAKADAQAAAAAQAQTPPAQDDQSDNSET